MSVLDTTSCATVVTANAGCGKTFRLTNVMIGWMVDHLRRTGDPGVTGILASTFTRKAAGEILERLLRHLAKGMRVPERLEEYEASFGLEDCPTVDELSTVLESVVAEMGRMQIGTIDGLFHRIAKAFPGETGLPEGWTIGSAPETRRLQAQSVDALINACASDELEHLAVAAEADVLKGGGQGRIAAAVWGPRGGGLLDLWRTCLVTAPPHAPADAAWRWMDALDDEDISPTAHHVSADERHALIDALEAAPLPLTAKGTENATWAKARRKIVHQARTEAWQDLLAEGLVQRVVCGERFARVDPTDDLVEALGPIIGHGRAILVRTLRARLTVWRGMLHGLDDMHHHVQREHGIFAFGDITDALARAQVFTTVDSQAIAFRLDNALRDIALDEFQDTSRAQFEILRPVLDELTAGQGAHESPRHLLVVADPKQSIYAWRGGTPALIDHIRQAGASSFPLARSYRSSPVIMAFVNELFGTLDVHPAINAEAQRIGSVSGSVVTRCNLRCDQSVIDAVAMLRERWRFSPHESAIDVPGEVRALASSDTTEESVLEQVVDVVRHRGPGSMGILCPKNEQVDAVVDALHAEGLAASHEGRGAVLRFTAVCRLFDVLWLGQHPRHTTAAFFVSHSPFGPLLDMPPLETIPRDERNETLSSVSRTIRRRVMDEGLDGFVASLVEAVAPACEDAEAAAMHHVARCASRWRGGPDTPLTAFVEFVEDQKIGAAGETGVRVMTMHGCKGLEFDEVLLPWLDDPLIKKRFGSFLPWSAGPLEPIEAVMPVVAEELRLHAPVLQAAHQQAIAAALADRLSLFYVAVTRPRQRLHLIFQPVNKTIDATLTPATLLRGSIDALEDAWQALPDGASGCFHTTGPYDDLQAKAPDSPPIAPVRIAASPPAMAEVTPSRVSHGVSCRLVSGRARRDGIILHELFARVGWLDDGPPDADALEDAFAAAAVQLGRPVGPDQRSALTERFRSALDSDVGDALRRAAHAHWDVDTLEVLPEEPLLTPLHDGLLRGRIDRLVLGKRAGQVVCASILDFKTGAAATPEAREAARDHYANQLERYARGVAGVWDLPSEAMVETGLLFIE